MPLALIAIALTLRATPRLDPAADASRDLDLPGVVLALSVSQQSAVALIPGLVLQGIGLGIVLTVNDPTGLTAVPPDDSGEAAGMINTSEQLGGALGIAALTAVELGVNFHVINERLAEKGVNPNLSQR